MSKIKHEKLNQNKGSVKHPPVPRSIQGNNKSIFYWLVAVIILTYIAFSPSLKNGFTNWDDNVYVAENSLITNLAGDNIKNIFNPHKEVSLNYHPLTVLSLAFDYKLSGYNPKTYHAVNLLFHLLNTALVFWFIFLLSGNKVTVAAIVALFFGIHPMHVESVAWISERKDVLYTFFFMGTLIAYHKYIHHTGKQKILLYVFLLFLFLCSTLSKAMAVVLPLVLLLMDFYSGRKFDKYVILEKLPFFALSIMFGMLAIHIQSGGAIAKLETFTLLQRFAFAFYGMINYIYKLFIPIHLSCFYPYPNLVGGNLPALFFIAPLIVIALFVLVLLSIRKTKVIIFGFLFFCITVTLVLQFISVGQVIMADRYAYIPYIGLIFPFAMGHEWLQKQDEKKYNIGKKISLLLITVFAAVCIWLTFERCKVWKNSDTLWTDAIKEYPCGETFRNRGSYLVNKVAYDKGQKNVGENEYDRALEDFNISLKMNPYKATVFTNRANIYGLKGKFDLALSDYSSAIALDKTDAQTFFNRAVTYSMMKQFDKAIPDFTTALKIKPDLITAKQNRAFAYIDNGNFKQAINDLNELIKSDANNANLFYYRAFAYNKTGDNLAALADNTNALQIDPGNSGAYFNRSAVNNDLGRFKDALSDALKARSLGYKVEESYLNELKRRTDGL